MKKGLLLVLVILCFSACGPNVYVIPGTFHVIEEQLKLELKVEPVNLKLGEEVTISASRTEGENKSLVVYSKSLGFSDTLTTPFAVKKIMTEIGIHDIMFETSNINPDTLDIEVFSSIGTTVNVTK